MKIYTNIVIIKKENSTEGPPKLKNKITVWPQQSYYQKACHYVNDIYTLMFNTLLLTIAKEWV